MQHPMNKSVHMFQRENSLCCKEAVCISAGGETTLLLGERPPWGL